VLLCVVCLAVAGGYLVLASRRAEVALRGAPSAPTGDPGALAQVTRAPHVVFLSTAVGDTYGKVAVAPLDAPDGPRYATPLQCDRVYFAAGTGLCLGNNVVGGFVSSYSGYTFDASYQPRQTFQQAGIPSRVRLAPDGRRGAWTVFVTGDEYAGTSFSTRTVFLDTASGAVLGDMEQFAITRDGAPFHAVDFNFWGVTFARDGNRFYATLATGGKYYLVEGDVDARTARVIYEGVECPSLSPDNTRLAFKKRQVSGGRTTWRLSLLDLATLTETPLGETRSVDDQVEWLDDDQIVYALAEDDGPPRTAATSLWTLPVDGSAPPRVLVPQAYSPAVVRQPSPGRDTPVTREPAPALEIRPIPAVNFDRTLVRERAMTEGLLWYDADARRPTAQKIEDAATRYRERFGRAANCCHVHPSEQIEHTAVNVVANPRIQPHHYWVGVDESLPMARAARRRGAA
jgi:hypothetical protein